MRQFDLDDTREDELQEPKWQSRLEEGILILLLLLSLVGVWISEFAPADSYWFWLVMIVVFAISAMIIGGIKAGQQGSPVKDMLLMQTLHWVASTLVVLATFSLLYTGRLSLENTGLVIMLILSLATFLDGIRIGWRFSMEGVFLALAAVVAAHFRNFMWIVVALAISIVLITIFWEGRRAGISEEEREED